MITHLPITKFTTLSFVFVLYLVLQEYLIDEFVSVDTELIDFLWLSCYALDDEYDCAGYSLRHYNETRIDQRLESIENAVSLYDQQDTFNILFLSSLYTASYLACLWKL